MYYICSVCFLQLPCKLCSYHGFHHRNRGTTGLVNLPRIPRLAYAVGLEIQAFLTSELLLLLEQFLSGALLAFFFGAGHFFIVLGWPVRDSASPALPPEWQWTPVSGIIYSRHTDPPGDGFQAVLCSAPTCWQDPFCRPQGGSLRPALDAGL